MTTLTTPSDQGLETPFPGLHATPPQTLPFAKDEVIRAFVLERDHGNVLVYNTATVPEVDVRWQYLGHWHEAMFDLDRVHGQLGVPVLSHTADAREVTARSGVQPRTFAHPRSLGEGFEIVPMPGHTPGSTAYLWEHGDHRFLFTADSLYLRGGEWVAAVLESSDRGAYLESLDVLRGLDFDVLVPWAATRGTPYAVRTDAADARRRIGAIIDRIWRGEDH